MIYDQDYRLHLHYMQTSTLQGSIQDISHTLQDLVNTVIQSSNVNNYALVECVKIPWEHPQNIQVKKCEYRAFFREREKKPFLVKFLNSFELLDPKDIRATRNNL